MTYILVFMTTFIVISLCTHYIIDKESCQHKSAKKETEAFFATVSPVHPLFFKNSSIA